MVFEFDREMINIVFRNLISNAVKYTRTEGLITISTKEIDDTIEISVKDTGIGMNKENTDLLFSPDLKRIKKEGTKGEKGTCLGLILCMEFIGKHQGSIWAESEPDKGSTFKIKLPRNHSMK